MTLEHKDEIIRPQLELSSTLLRGMRRQAILLTLLDSLFDLKLIYYLESHLNHTWQHEQSYEL